jgi:hypothetical protein
MTGRVRAMTLCALAAGCGGGGTSGPDGVETQTFTGSTSAQAAGSCTGDTHRFNAGDGTVSVTLAGTSTGDALTAEICPGASTSNDCTLSRRRIDIGQTLSATRRGGVSQVLSLLPLTCGAGGPPPAGPIDYTATVTYPRS